MNIFGKHITWMHIKDDRGFSLIELAIVLALFAIIIGVAVDIFISMLHNQKRVLDEQEMLNQASFATEYISTALKSAVVDSSGSCLGTSGYVYLLTHCPNGTLVACNGIKFINQLDNNTCEEFYLDTVTNPASPALMVAKNNLPAQSLLSTVFTIKYLNFILDGNKALHVTVNTDTVQPKVTLLFDIQTTLGTQQEKIIQTTISQRNLNY